MNNLCAVGFLMAIAVIFAQDMPQPPSSIIVDKGNMTFNLCVGCDLLVARKFNSSAGVTVTTDSLISASQVQALFTSYLTPINAQITTLQTQLVQEQSRALFAESALQTMITQESSRAVGTEASVSLGLASETSRAIAKEATINSALLSETSRAISAETSTAARVSSMTLVEASLGVSVGTETSRAGVVEGSLGTSIAQEVTRATNSETSISTSVNNERLRALGAEGSVATSLSQEITRATGIDASLGTSAGAVLNTLTQEITRAVSQDSSLQAGIASVASSVTSEVTRATGAEAALGLAASLAVGLELTRAAGVESSLGVSVSAERSRALAAEIAETVRATGVEASLAGTVSIERSRALAAESAETVRATGVEASLGLSVAAVLSNVNTEVGRASSVEGSLSLSLASERSRAIATTCLLGLTQNTPAISCMQILRSGCSYATTSGVYWLIYNFVPAQAYCDQVSYGGGWELIMKMAQGTTFTYAASYWTSPNTLNPSANLDASYGGTDNKYNGFNYGQYNQVLARFSFNGQWDWPITNMNVAAGSSLTPLAFFNQASYSLGNQVSTNYFTNGGGKWSNQGGYQSFGINNCCYYASAAVNSCVRFGFTWNNEADCGTNDVSGGIGLSSYFRSYSAGDAALCCQLSSGANTNFNAQLWARLN